jgi:uncharacterized protein YkwD
MEDHLAVQPERTETPNPWFVIVKYSTISALALIVFFSVFLYFRELVLLFSYRALVLAALFFTFITVLGSIFLFIRAAIREFKILEGTPRILFVAILIVVTVLAVVAASVGMRVLPKLYGDKTETLTLSGISAYLSVSPDAIALPDVAQRIHALVNAERAKQGKTVLSYDSALEKIAQNHSNDMAANLYLEHINKAGEDAIARGNKAGYTCKKDYGVIGNTRLESAGIGENLALTTLGNVVGCGGVYTAEDIARCTVDGWLNSTEHKKNILMPTYAREGIGIARVEKTLYITQNFC